MWTRLQPWSPDDTILPTPPFNATTITLTLVFWQVSKPAFDQEFTSQMTWRLGRQMMMMMMQCTAGRELDERACCGDCVRARAYSCAWVTDSDRVELRRTELSSDKVYSRTGSIGRGFETLSAAWMRRKWQRRENMRFACVGAERKLPRGAWSSLQVSVQSGSPGATRCLIRSLCERRAHYCDGRLRWRHRRGAPLKRHVRREVSGFGGEVNTREHTHGLSLARSLALSLSHIDTHTHSHTLYPQKMIWTVFLCVQAVLLYVLLAQRSRWVTSQLHLLRLLYFTMTKYLIFYIITNILFITYISLLCVAVVVSSKLSLLASALTNFICFFITMGRRCLSIQAVCTSRLFSKECCSPACVVDPVYSHEDIWKQYFHLLFKYMLVRKKRIWFLSTNNHVALLL